MYTFIYMKNIRTHLYCYDDHRGLAEEIKKKFADLSRYSVLAFQVRDEYLERFEKDREDKFCKIAILGLHENADNYELFDHLAQEIKKTDPRTAVIIVCPPDRMEEIRKTLKFSIDAFIPRNPNSILRIHNSVKKLISEFNISVLRRRRNVSLIIFSVFLVVALFMLILAYFRMPAYF